jgi:hypothetical protein
MASLLAPLLLKAGPEHGSAPSQVLRLIRDYLAIYRARSELDEQWADAVMDGLRERLRSLVTSLERRSNQAWRLSLLLALAALVALISWAVAAFATAASADASRDAGATTTWVSAITAAVLVGGLALTVRGSTELRTSTASLLVLGLVPSLVVLVVLVGTVWDHQASPGPAVLLSGVLVVAVTTGSVIWLWRAGSDDPADEVSVLLDELALAGSLRSAPASDTGTQQGRVLVDWLAAHVRVAAGRMARLAHRWTWVHYLLGGLAAGTAGAATALTAAPGNTPSWVAAGLAALAATFSGLLTALNPGARLQEARTTELTLESLHREVVLQPALQAESWSTAAGQQAFLKYLVEHFEQAIGVPAMAKFEPGGGPPNAPR